MCYIGHMTRKSVLYSEYKTGGAFDPPTQNTIYMYYINSCILCLCLSVSVFVTTEISAKGRRIGTLLSATWRASPGKLCRLVIQLVRHVVREKKPLELFTDNA